MSHRIVPRAACGVRQDKGVRIVMAGSSGFLGSHLTRRLRSAGHQVVRLVRRPARAPDEVSWQAADGPLDPAALAGVDAVVNLAGSPLGTRIGPVNLPVRRWSASYRRQFRASRVGSTTTLARAIAEADPKPAVFLSGSGVSWYGDTGDAEVDERAPFGEGYFATVSRDWEAATAPAVSAGVRVVHLRTGFPLAGDGGLLGPQLLPFRLGLGGKLGSGRQWQPYVSLEDWLSAAVFLLEHDVSGPVNMVGPHPTTNAEFTRILGRMLHRPTVVPIPAVALKTLLGEFGKDALASRRAVPRVLLDAGFRFRHPDVTSMLRAALARRSD